jgi:hypothetical protein
MTCSRVVKTCCFSVRSAAPCAADILTRTYSDTHILVPEIGTLYMTRNYDDADDDQELYIPRNAAAAAALS